MLENTAYHRWPVRQRVHVTLTCGCMIKLKDNPYRRGARYCCPSNLGHGYNLTWTSYTDTLSGGTIENPDIEENN